MRISSCLAPILAPLTVAGFAIGSMPAAWAFDGTRTPATQMTAVEAFRDGARALMQGKTDKALSALQYAADNGHPLAQWKLGHMYAKGDGVPQNDLRAFEYFSRVANSHADDRPDTPQARVVANAFVSLGQYYLEGIPHSDIHPNPARAREMYHYAATYFADPDAQYGLARMCLDGVGGPRDPRRAIRWLALGSAQGPVPGAGALGGRTVQGQGDQAAGLARIDVAYACPRRGTLFRHLDRQSL